MTIVFKILERRSQIRGISEFQLKVLLGSNGWGFEWPTLFQTREEAFNKLFEMVGPLHYDSKADEYQPLQ